MKRLALLALLPNLREINGSIEDPPIRLFRNKPFGSFPERAGLLSALRLAPLLALLLGACATGSTPQPFVPGPVNPFASIVVRAGAADACDNASRDGAALLAKVSAAETLAASGDVLSAVESALLAGADARRAFYLDLLIQAVQTSGNVPKTIALSPGSPAAQLVTAALAGCRAGIALNANRVRAEALEAPAPSLSGYLFKVGYTDSIAKGTFFFDTSLPVSQRHVHGKLNLGAPSGTYERVGLPPGDVKGPEVGPEGANCSTIQEWIDHDGPAFGVPAGYQCSSADIFDALYTDGRRGNNAWNDLYVAAALARHPPVPEPTGPAVNPLCVSGQCFPEQCPANCTTAPPTPAPPPVVPGCPTAPALKPFESLLTARQIDTLKQLRAGHTVANPARYRELVLLLAAHPGLLEPR